MGFLTTITLHPKENWLYWIAIILIFSSSYYFLFDKYFSNINVFYSPTKKKSNLKTNIAYYLLSIGLGCLMMAIILLPIN